MADMKMMSMKIDPKEREQEYATTKAEAADMPAYPYGLCLRLEEDAMKKLKMTTLPAVGSQVMVHAMADVVSVRESESVLGGKSQCVELQITDLAPPAPVKKGTADALYGE